MIQRGPQTMRELVKYWAVDIVEMACSAAALMAFVGFVVVVCEYMR